MKTPRSYFIVSGLAAALLLLPFAVHAKINCSSLPHWVKLNNGLALNQIHVFCGEFDRKPKGFHSRPGGQNPSTVSKFTIQDRPNAAGIYSGRWSYSGHPEKNKFSSMFPDSCTKEQVLNSIAHAVSSPSKCPAGSPNWVKCGHNRPEQSGGDLSAYCHVGNHLFAIGYAPAHNNKVNTAFPIRE